MFFFLFSCRTLGLGFDPSNVQPESGFVPIIHNGGSAVPSLAFSVLDDADITGGGGSGATGGKQSPGDWDSLGSEKMLPIPGQGSHLGLVQSREATTATGASADSNNKAAALVGLGRASSSATGVMQPLQVSTLELKFAMAGVHSTMNES